MKRQLFNNLIGWKNNPQKKPLLLQGARQVGKTYLLQEFGREFYPDLAYFNFEKSPDLKDIFSGDLSPQNIVEKLGLYREKKIEEKRTLIFLDEIQVCPEAISSLKYFCEEASVYDVVAAGSLLGVKVGKGLSFPVGKVNFMSLYPMSFKEYLKACGLDLLCDVLIHKKDFEVLDEANHVKLLEHLKKYLVIGGMPEVVATYIETVDFQKAREVQKEILLAYQNDFSKYASNSESIKILKIWNSLPIQLARENKKFKYNDIAKGARASSYELSIEWLKNAGLIYVSCNVSKPFMPLSGYYEHDKFKLFMLDNGLLGCMLDVSPKIIIEKDTLFSQYNGAFIENYVAGELIKSRRHQLSYWTSKSDAEVDFLLQVDDKIIPLEVKSGLSKNIKSLRSYQIKYNPEYILRTSPKNYVKSEEFMNIPLYTVGEVFSLLEK